MTFSWLLEKSRFGRNKGSLNPLQMTIKNGMVKWEVWKVTCSWTCLIKLPLIFRLYIWTQTCFLSNCNFHLRHILLTVIYNQYFLVSYVILLLYPFKSFQNLECFLIQPKKKHLRLKTIKILKPSSLGRKQPDSCEIKKMESW